MKKRKAVRHTFTVIISGIAIAAIAIGVAHFLELTSGSASALRPPATFVMEWR